MGLTNISPELVRLRDTLAPFFRRMAARRALVFGSFARNTQTRRSDLDLLVVKDTEQRFFDRYDGVLEGLYGLVKGRDIEVLIYTPAELESIRHRPFIRTILSEGVWIYESGEKNC